MNKLPFLLSVVAFLACSPPMGLRAASPPPVGVQAPDFALKTLDDQTVRLSDFTAQGKVVLIVLRGWPGYQCPICTRQVHDYVTAAAGFVEAKARVVMVYPGPADDLRAHASEFLSDKQWPKEFIFVIDPAYAMVDAFGLRWNKPKETAYPSTFLLDRHGVVRYETISHTHGERTKAAESIAELKLLPES